VAARAATRTSPARTSPRRTSPARSSPAAAAAAPLALEYLPLDTLQAWERNPKLHDVGAIVVSMRENGFRAPLVVNRKTQVVEAGHGRRLALLAMKEAGEAPPRFIRVAGDQWLVPALCFEDDELSAMRYAIADNRVHDLGGGWDMKTLTQILADLAREDEAFLMGTGYDAGDVDRLLRNQGLMDTLDQNAARLVDQVSCPACHTRQSKMDPGGFERRVCGTCGTALTKDSASQAGAATVAALTIALIPEDRADVLKALELAKERGCDGNGIALALICREWQRAQ
jgi:hypothetical protein